METFVGDLNTALLNKEKKTKYGQFYTTNYKKILQNLYIPIETTKIIEPFAGNGDLLKFINDEIKTNVIIECYDIDPKHDYIVKRDTLIDPPIFTNSFIITNPPYLSRNKSKDKTLYDKYKVNDLYKCFIKILLDNRPSAGIIIIPLNFWASVRKMDINLRKNFLRIYSVIRINIFEEPVFNDTTITVCATQFKLGTNFVDLIPIDIYPSKQQLKIILNEENNYTIGGDIYNLSNKGVYKISRLIKGQSPTTQIIAKCIDDSVENKIMLKFVEKENIYYDDTKNKSARTYATLNITPQLTICQQKKLVDDFNKFLNKKREEFNSLFLPNFRESKHKKNGAIARKRITFNLIYKIVAYLLEQNK